MSQHWHGNWTETTFAPKRLRNWEVPKWYPSWPDKHCVTTKFIADDNGCLLDSAKKIKHSAWGTYKVNGTWDLPKKITRSMAQELSATPQYKKEAWELHRKKHQNLCKKVDAAKKKRAKEATDPPHNSMERDQAVDIQKSRAKEEKEDKKSESI